MTTANKRSSLVATTNMCVVTERTVPLVHKLLSTTASPDSPKSSPKKVIPSSSMTFQELMNSLPSDVFERSSRKAILSIVVSIALITVGTLLTRYTPWFLLPANWLFVGVVACGLFAVGYNCSQESFFNSSNTPSWVNSVVGATSMMVLLYPYESFKRLQMNLNKNMANEKEEMKDLGFVASLYNWVRSLANGPFWFLASAFEWITTNVYYEGTTSVVVNAVCVYAFAALLFSLTIYFGGVWTLFKYYLAPLIVFHICMSTFLKVNEIGNRRQQGTQITSFPSILEILTNCANHSYVIRFKWNTPKKVEDDDDSDDEEEEEEVKNKQEEEEHSTLFNSMQEALSSLVPSYNLRKAKAALAKLDGINFDSFKLSQIKETLTTDGKGEPLDLSKVDWVISIYLIGSLLGTLYGFLFCTWYWKTWVLSFVGYQLAGLGITAGYHRLFSHRSYQAHPIVRYVLLALGTSSFQGSVLSWSSDHRVHHRYTDTNRDPYDITKGFWFAHWGWLFLKRESEVKGVEDLQADPVICFQHEHYQALGFILCYLVPCVVAGWFWGDYWGGFWIGGVLKTTFLQHCTFFINSLAHIWGEATFTQHRSARNSYVVSLFTFGEGYHNTHHEFPFDYRNGIHFYDYDPGKWLIASLYYLGLAWDLKMFCPDLFEKGRIQQLQRKVDEAKKKLEWGPDVEQLEVKTWEDFQTDIKKKDRQYMVINNIAHDVTGFAAEHPGGKAFVDAWIGKDATEPFLGGSYNHSNAAKNLLATKRAYLIKDVPSSKAVKKIKAA